MYGERRIQVVHWKRLKTAPDREYDQVTTQLLIDSCKRIPFSKFNYICFFLFSQIYVKNFTLALQHEFSPYGITVQLVTPMYVRTKMNEYSSTVMAGGNIMIPDVQSYTKCAVFSLGKTNETTGYWSHGLQVNIYSKLNITSTKLQKSYLITVCGNTTDTNLVTFNYWQKNEYTIS